MAHWRVEFNYEGAIRSVEKCLDADEETSLVVYVKAKDKEGAKAAAYRARQRLLLRARRAQYRREGKCKCGRPLDDPKRSVQCSLCRERRRRDGRNSRARTRGEDPPEPTAGKSPAFRAQRASARDADRATILLEVARRFEHSNTIAEFSNWLAGELRAVGIHSTKRSA